MVNSNFALIKSASSDCPLHCKYCFYHDIASNRDTYTHHKMSCDLLTETFNYYTSNAQYQSSFLFQGGEPLLAGKDYFAHYVNLIKELKKTRPNFQVFSSIQTCALPLDDEFCRILKDGNFLLGISLDGAKEQHDANRIYKNGKGSFNQVMEKIELIRKHNLDFNILTVVNQNNVHEPQLLWDFFMQNGFSHIQFIPGLKSINSEGCLISPKEYADFILVIFDLWYQSLLQGKVVNVRLFEDIFSRLSNAPCTSCDMQGHCSNQNVLEANGDIYPCDFYVVDKWKLGSIKFKAIDLNKEQAFINHHAHKINFPDKIASKPCDNCNLYHVCKNGCARYRINGINFLCDTYKQLFSKRKENIDHVLSMLGV